MPDGDRIERGMRHGWRPAYRRLKGGASPAELAPRLLKGLAATLRTEGGVPGLRAYGLVIESHAAGLLTTERALERIRRIQRSQPYGHLSMIAAHGVARCVTENGPGTTLVASGERLAAGSVCRELLDAELFERARPAVVGDLFETQNAYDRYTEACREQIGEHLVRLANQLLDRPTGEGVRAPAVRRAPRRSTADVLGDSLLG